MAERRRMIDWAEARRQMADRNDALRRVLEGGEAWSEVEAERRAEALSRPLAEVAPVAMVLLMAAAAARYAIPVAAVRRVEPMIGCTPVPQAPPDLLGLAHCAGERWLLFDLDRLANPQARDTLAPDQGHAVLLRHARYRVGLRCHRAEALVPLQGLAEAPATGLALVSGLLPGRVALLDADALIDRVVEGL